MTGTAGAPARDPSPTPSPKATSPVVALNRFAAAAHGFEPRDITHAPAGAVLVSADGTTLRVTAEGALDPVALFGFRSIASDPAARVCRSATCNPRSNHAF